MPSAYTSLLGLVQPATGELNGVWGSTINAQQTQLVEDAVAGYATADVTSADWTLTTTGGGAANQARMAMLIATGTPSVTRSIIAPKQSKIYVVCNATSVPIVIKGGPTSPTTGVTVPAGSAFVVAWSASAGDFVAASSVSSGGGAAVGGGHDAVFIENDNYLTTSYTLGASTLAFCTISIASPCVVTQSNTYVGGEAVCFSTTGALPTGLSTDTTYYVSTTGLTGSAFQVSATRGGASVDTSGTQSGTQTSGKAKSASTVGPLTINSGVTLTIPTGQRLVVL